MGSARCWRDRVEAHTAARNEPKKETSMRQLVLTCLSAALTVCGMAPLTGFPQTFPTKPIRIIVPFPPVARTR